MQNRIDNGAKFRRDNAREGNLHLRRVYHGSTLGTGEVLLPANPKRKPLTLRQSRRRAWTRKMRKGW